eukprot:1146833-Pelagomonas_calceolata.AAC.1
MMCKITLLFLFGFLELWVLSLAVVLARWAVAAYRMGKGWARRPGIERTRRASGRLWWRAEEPVPLGKTQSGTAQEMFSGTPQFVRGVALSAQDLAVPLGCGRDVGALLRQGIQNNWMPEPDT